MPYDGFAAGLGDYRIVTTLCPLGKERMRRLMNLVQTGRFGTLPLLTHRFSLDNIVEAYELLADIAMVFSKLPSNRNVGPIAFRETEVANLLP